MTKYSDSNGLVLLLVPLLFLNAAFAKLELTMAIEIFRHGARASIEQYYWNNWTHFGELTANGAREHFTLGLEVAKRYRDLLPFQFDPELIRVQSTHWNRTIHSAYSQLAGVFSTGDTQDYPRLHETFDLTLLNPPSNLSTKSSNLQNQSSALPSNYNPIPVHVTEKRYDHILTGYNSDTCPYIATLIQNQLDYLFTSQEMQALRDELQPFVTQAVKNRWIASTDESSLEALLQTTRVNDWLMTGYTDGRPVPFLPGSDNWKGYEYVYQVVSQVQLNSNPLQWQLGSGNFLNLVLEYFTNKTQNLTTYNFLFFSAHDSNLISILSALNQTSVGCFQQKYRNKSYVNPTCVYPTYASSIFFELWTNSVNRSDVSVKVVYNDMILQLCGQDFCGLEEVANVINAATGGIMFSQYLQICNYGLPSTTIPSFDWISALHLVLIIVLSVGILFSLKIKVLDTTRENWSLSERKNMITH